jgi:hypothetical protein
VLIVALKVIVLVTLGVLGSAAMVIFRDSLAFFRIYREAPRFLTRHKARELGSQEKRRDD